MSDNMASETVEEMYDKLTRAVNFEGRLSIGSDKEGKPISLCIRGNDLGMITFNTIKDTLKELDYEIYEIMADVKGRERTLYIYLQITEIT